MSTGGMFDLGRVISDGARQVENTVKRQEAELEAQRRRTELTLAANESAKVINEQSQQSAAATRAQQLGVLEGINEEISRAETAIALSRSDNPLDRVKLWALQQTSQSYTREGNQARINWYTNAANAVGMGEVIRQQGYADQLSNLQQEIDYAMMEDEASLDILKTIESQGAELINAYRTQQANQLEYLQNQNAMQEAALDNVNDSETLQAARQESLASATGTTVIGGVEISTAKIDERIANLENAEFLTWQRQQTRQATLLQGMTLDQIEPFWQESRQSPDGIAIIGGTPVTQAAIEERRRFLKTAGVQEQQADLANISLVRSKQMEMDSRLLWTMSVGQLNDIVAAGGYDATRDIQYNLDEVVSLRDRKALEKEGALSEEALRSQVGNPMDMAARAVESFEGIKATPGTPLAAAIESQTSVVNAMAGYLQSEDPQEFTFAAQAIQGARDAVDSAISAEAASRSMGNKDLEAAYNYMLRGMPLPPELVESAIQKLSSKGESFRSWLTSGPNGTAAVYDRVYQESKRSLAMDPSVMMGNWSKSDIEAEAHSMAMEAVKQAATAGLTEQIAMFQFQMPSNPLNGVLAPTEFLQLQQRTNQSGAEAYAKATGMSDEDLQARLSGTVPDSDLAAVQDAHLLTALEQRQPGLAKAYTDWWNSEERINMIPMFDAARTENSSTSVQQLAEWSLIRPDVANMMTTNALQLQSGHDVTLAEELRSEYTSFVTFGGNPENQQLFLLESDPTLTGQQKQQIMETLISPLLEDASRQNMNYEEAVTFVEVQLTRMRPGEMDLDTRRLYNALMNGRQESLRITNLFASQNPRVDTPFSVNNIWRSSVNPMLLGGLSRLIFPGEDEVSKQTSQYDWWQK